MNDEIPRRPPPIERVAPIPGEIACYFVRSYSRPSIIHRIQLEDYKWNGACGCENFEFAHRNHLENGAAPSLKRQCNHIKDARFLFVQTYGPRIVKVLRSEQGRHAQYLDVLQFIEKCEDPQAIKAIFAAAFKRSNELTSKET